MKTIALLLGVFFFFSVCLFICLLVFARGVKTLGKCNKGKAFIE